jgi:hypothetical protein
MWWSVDRVATRGWRAAVLALAVMGAIAGCEPLRRRLVIVLDEPVAGHAALIEVVIVRPAEGDPDGPTGDAALDALPADGSPDAAPADTPPTRTCEDLLDRTGEVEFTDSLAHSTFAPSAPISLGPFGDGRVLVLVRVRDEDCRLAQACREVDLGGRDENDVLVEISDFLAEDVTCPLRYRCAAGRCDPCGGCCDDVECNDHTPGTTDVCVRGSCDVAVDLDRDGVPAPADCDDRVREAYPGAFPACGYSLDHDCDGVVDETDGCGAPQCWLGTAQVLETYPELQAQSLAQFGGLVVAALYEASGIVLWLGSLDGGGLSEVGRVAIEGTEGGLRPQDLVVYRDKAYLLTSSAQRVEIVDLSSPGAPAHVGSVELDRTRLSQSLTVAPPLLWIARLGGFDALDLSQVAPDLGWPDVAAVEVPLAGLMGIGFELRIRNGLGYVIAVTPNIRCFGMASPSDVPRESEICFSADAAIDALFITTDGTIIAASRGAGAVQPAVWSIPTDAEGVPIAANARVLRTTGDPRAVVVVGRTIVRSTTIGLSLHSTSALDARHTMSVDFDDDPATIGPSVWETLVFGTTAVAAVQGVGVVTLELSCVE